MARRVVVGLFNSSASQPARQKELERDRVRSGKMGNKTIRIDYVIGESCIDQIKWYTSRRMTTFVVYLPACMDDDDGEGVWSLGIS